MTLQQNIPLYNLFILTISLLLFITIFAAIFADKLSLGLFFTLFLLAGALFYSFRRFRSNAFSALHGEFDEINEKINLSAKSLEEKKEACAHLPLQRKKVAFLFKTSQDLIELIDVEEIFDFLIGALEKLFPQADNILFFDFNSEKGVLSLTRSLKRTGSIVKEKKGDELDRWVLRHNQSLLIEDLARDFRFDYSKVGAYKDRGINSFIVSPISLGYTLLGTVRLESKKSLSFSLDDSRIFRYICDLGAVVLGRAELFKNAQDLAIKDSLTSLFVKDYFFKRMEEELKRIGKREAGLGVIMLDIDDFKKINDTHGHIVGDFVLKKLAIILNAAVRGPGSVIARFGGEEFIIFLIECDREKLLSKAEEIRQKVELAGLNFRRKRIDFTVSLGAVFYSGGSLDARELAAKADELLYKAKSEGKNKVCFSG
ncbi:MAG: sensor domain-containing diguanylate cyclase [Candidatus Omnitrophota bacterium]